MGIPQRYSLVTLGVADVPAATDFYRRLGWRESSASVAGDVSFFATPGGVLALWGTADLAADAGTLDLVADSRTADAATRHDAGALPGPDAAARPARGRATSSAPPFRAVALAINLGSRLDVDAAIEAWTKAGGTISRPAAPTDWGGYSGYVADPDGNLWEFAHNPFWPLDERGIPVLPADTEAHDPEAP